VTNNVNDAGYFASIIMSDRAELIMKNSHLYTTDDSLSVSPTGIVNIMASSPSSISLENSKLSLVDVIYDGSTPPGIETHHIMYSTGEGNIKVNTIRLNNSQFMNISELKDVGDEVATVVRGLGDPGFPSDLYVIADDNIFARGATGIIPRISNASGSCFFTNELISLKISYVSRNIHSYNVTYNTSVSPQEFTGEAASFTSLGVTGYGLNERYNVILAPYNI
jgi:hypothetical protein